MRPIRQRSTGSSGCGASASTGEHIARVLAGETATVSRVLARAGLSR
ncbi:hypothetical protein GHK69_07290 [Sinorhizobium meliloti]|nr:hypothetical protein [Sinorhizobium meliloti]